MRQLRCHRCGSAELVLYETRKEHAEYDGGLFVNEDGHIEAHSAGYFAAGDPMPALTRIECTSCGHDWHPRRTFDGNYIYGVVAPANRSAPAAETGED